AAKDSSLSTVLAAALDTAEDTVRRAPELLDILRQAGVVDAGGQGLAILLAGLQRFAEGTTLSIPSDETVPVSTAPAAEMDFLDHLDELHDAEEFGYCTNFLLTGDNLPVEEVRRRITELGTSAVVVGDKTMLKIHVHSEHPGTILEIALGYGELHQVRIDNMTAQTRALLEDRHAAHPTAVAPSTADTTDIALVAVASGDGLTEALRGLGATAVVPGGPTVNPTTEEILRVILALPQRQVILLRYYLNVIPAARRVAGLIDACLGVATSRSLPRAISALVAFNFDSDLEETVAARTEALGIVRSLALTRATRSVEVDGGRV